MFEISSEHKAFNEDSFINLLKYKQKEAEGNLLINSLLKMPESEPWIKLIQNCTHRDPAQRWTAKRVLLELKKISYQEEE